MAAPAPHARAQQCRAVVLRRCARELPRVLALAHVQLQRRQSAALLRVGHALLQPQAQAVELPAPRGPRAPRGERADVQRAAVVQRSACVQQPLRLAAVHAPLQRSDGCTRCAPLAVQLRVQRGVSAQRAPLPVPVGRVSRSAGRGGVQQLPVRFQRAKCSAQQPVLNVQLRDAKAVALALLQQFKGFERVQAALAKVLMKVNARGSECRQGARTHAPKI